MIKSGRIRAVGPEQAQPELLELRELEEEPVSLTRGCQAVAHPHRELLRAERRVRVTHRGQIRRAN
jgi:hypothetical protein